jgi:[FeFe] hydrogenase (group B1/B3)
MKGIYTPITKIRRQVFAEVARIAFEEDEDYSKLDEAPFKILPGEIARFRDSIFKERSIVGERIRLAMGLSLRRVDEHSRVSLDAEKVNVPHRIHTHPLVNVITFACEACPTKSFYVTDNCRKCLAHPCVTVCPVNAVSLQKDRAYIDKEKCVKCGKCKEVCPYSAIVSFERPCAVACGVDAIESDHLGRAKINEEKCVACGMCIVNCPFGAIADKSEIFQLIKALKGGKKIYAEIAPSFVGQFGPLATPGKIISGLKRLGFEDVVEVALGADVASIHEAEVFVETVPEKQPFLGTSCCPSWTMTVEKFFPELRENISSSHTPMVETAKTIKEKDPEAKIVFIGPCISKKLEALETEVTDYIDFVITFEELIGMFVAKDIDLADIEEDIKIQDASVFGRGYANSGGVADAIINNIQRLYPDRKIDYAQADSLTDCRKMLAMAKAGKRDGYLIEGMACPGGCIGGPGTVLPTVKGERRVREFAKTSPYPTALDNPHSNDRI